MTYIGNRMETRMAQLYMKPKDLAEKVFLEQSVIKALLTDQLPLEDMDEFDIRLLESALHCPEGFFTDEQVAGMTLDFMSNRDSQQVAQVKSQIQDILRDTAWITEMIE